MRTSRKKQRNQNAKESTGTRNHLKKFRAKVGSQQIRKINLIGNVQRKYQSGISPLNRDSKESALVNSRTRFRQQQHQQDARQNEYSQRRALQIYQGKSRRERNAYGEQGVGQGRNSGRSSARFFNKAASQVTASQAVQPSGSYQAAPVIRGRLKSNFGLMRSDLINPKQQQQPKYELHQPVQQRQLQPWLRKSLQQLKAGGNGAVHGVPKTSSARTAIYDPSSTVTVQISNIVNSKSDVSVVFGRQSKKKVRDNAQERSVYLYRLSDSTNQPAAVKGRDQSQSLVSFDEDIDVETDFSPVAGSLSQKSVAMKTKAEFEDVDCSVLIV